jgi:hypothetical protein
MEPIKHAFLTDSALSLRVQAARWLSLASLQNHVPVIRELTVELKSAESARHLELRVNSSPGFIVAAHGTIVIARRIPVGTDLIVDRHQ